jgi:hypothetical protein
MSTDLKADLLEHLDGQDGPWRRELRARLQSATITEPPPPDPCVVEHFSFSTARPPNRDYLLIQTAGKNVAVTRSEAAALIPALQAFVREGGQQ